MSIVPLSCPKCGGSLEIDEFATKAKCPFCGTEHVVHNDGSGAVELEFHARCPRCKRNDQVRVLTAIHLEGTTLAGKLSPPVEPGLEHTLPVLCREELRKQAVDNRVTIIAKLFLAVVIIVGGVINQLALLYLAGAAFLIYFLFDGLKKWTAVRDIDRLVKERQKSNRIIISRNEAALELWESKVAIWRRLYYCSRDDCVFLPGLDKSASPNILTKFIEALMEDAQPSQDEA